MLQIPENVVRRITAPVYKNQDQLNRKHESPGPVINSS